MNKEVEKDYRSPDYRFKVLSDRTHASYNQLLKTQNNKAHSFYQVNKPKMSLKN